MRCRLRGQINHYMLQGNAVSLDEQKHFPLWVGDGAVTASEDLVFIPAELIRRGDNRLGFCGAPGPVVRSPWLCRR